MIIRAKAPLRISFGGGGTDVSPYPQDRGGVTMSVTIDKYAYCTLTDRDDKQISIKSLDYNLDIIYDINDKIEYNNQLDIVKATIKVLKINKGLNLFVSSDAPPGSGLGASSTVTVALIGALSDYLRYNLTAYEIAELAYYVERDELKLLGGRQDQYASTFGGFNFTEYFANKTIVNPIRVKRDVVNELGYRLLLCYTGKTRLSAGIISDQVSGYIQGKKNVVRALDQTKELAIAIKNSLLLGQLDELGDLLNAVWNQKKQLSTKISNPEIDEMYETARKKGALGGKLLGAGGGGYMLFLCEFDKKYIVAKNLENLGGRIVNFDFEFNGLQTWEVLDPLVFSSMNNSKNRILSSIMDKLS